VEAGKGLESEFKPMNEIDGIYEVGRARLTWGPRPKNTPIAFLEQLFFDGILLFPGVSW